MYNKILEMAELAYRSGGDPEALLLHPTKASELVESMGITEGFSTGGLTLEVLNTPFGSLKIYVDKLCPRETIYVLTAKDARRIVEESKRMIAEMFGNPK